MVADTRAAPGASPGEPVDPPQQVEVQTGPQGWPVAVRWGDRWRAAGITDSWLVEDEWWRAQPVARAYFALVLDGVRPLTVFQDRVTGQWYRQPYE